MSWRCLTPAGLCVISKCFWNIGASTNFPAKYTCRSLLLSLFVKTLLLKSPGIFVSSLKWFLESSFLLHWIICLKLFFKCSLNSVRCNITSQTTWPTIQNSFSWWICKFRKCCIFVDSMTFCEDRQTYDYCWIIGFGVSSTLVVTCGENFQYIRFATIIEWICIFDNTLGNMKELRFK